ncbi:MAG: hypothetical protein LUI13_01650 [Lachnospiraceae bacterium]|nr:hypothetical protein [Lachnospiraceae bacterium]
MSKTKDSGFLLDDSELAPYSKQAQEVHELEKTLSSLTPEQREQYAAQYNGGLGSGMSPEEYRQYIQSLKDDEPQPRKRPGIEENVWSRFDDDGWGIYNVQPAPTDNTDKNDK